MSAGETPGSESEKTPRKNKQEVREVEVRVVLQPFLPAQTPLLMMAASVLEAL